MAEATVIETPTPNPSTLLRGRGDWGYCQKAVGILAREGKEKPAAFAGEVELLRGKLSTKPTPARLEPSNREAQPVTVTWSKHGAARVVEGETMGWDARPNMVALLCACAGKEWEGRDEGWGTSRAHHGGPQKSRLRFCLRALGGARALNS